MQVSLSHKLNQHFSYNQQNSKTNKKAVKQTSIHNSNPLPTFKSTIASTVTTYVFTKRISDTVMGTRDRCLKTLERKKQLEPIIAEPKSHLRELAGAITSFAKMSPHIDDGIIYNIFTRDQMDSISKMKKDILTKVFPVADDRIGYNKVAKKEFLTTIFESGEYTSPEFLEAFRTLPDNLYKNFKEEICDKILYSLYVIHNTNQHPTQLFHNFKMIDSLDKNIYSEYIQNNLQGIMDLRSKCFDTAAKTFQNGDQLNYAYEYYLSDFSCISLGDKTFSGEEGKLWQPFVQGAFFNCIKKANGDIQKVAQFLNCEKDVANSIVEDLKALTLGEQANTKSQKLLIYSNRLKEKFQVKFNINKKRGGDYNHITYRSNLFNSINHSKDVGHFIKKTGYTEELTNLFKKELERLDENIENDKSDIRSADDDLDFDIRRWAHQL